MPNIICPCGATHFKDQAQLTETTGFGCSEVCEVKTSRRKGTFFPCKHCGTYRYKSPSLMKSGFGIYCSRKCEALSRPNPPVERICELCGTTFMKPWWDVNKFARGGSFCSRTCIDKFKRKLRKRGEQEMFTGWQKREWRTNYCAKCGAIDKLELDHKVPRFAGGKATKENAQTLCRTCNRKKFWEDDYELYKELLLKRALNY